MVIVRPRQIRTCRDPKDGKSLELAVNSGANSIVSVMAACSRSIFSGAYASLRRTPFWEFNESGALKLIGEKVVSSG